MRRPRSRLRHWPSLAGGWREFQIALGIIAILVGVPLLLLAEAVRWAGSTLGLW